MVVQIPPEPEVESAATRTEAGVIKDARARHRRERWAGALIAAIAVGIGLLFVLGGGGGGAGAGRHDGAGGTPGGAGHSSSQPLAVISGHGVSANEFGLLSAGAGWAVLENGFDLTRDGGLRWAELSTDTHHGSHYGTASVRGFGLTGDFTANITATSSPSARVLAIGFVDGRAAPSCKPPRYPATGAGAILLTADAGRSWSTHILPGCNVAASLSFINARVGYAVLPLSTHESELYRTVDGARRWRLVNRFQAPLAVSFGTREDGLALVTTNNRAAAGALYRTTDGGRTWQRSRFCGSTTDPTRTVYCGVPTSFGNRGVVLAVVQNLGKTRSYQSYVYTTMDGGSHWIRHRLPPLESPEAPSFSAPNPDDLFAYSLSGLLYTSTDGGRTWKSIRAPAFRKFDQMQFVSADYGWVLAGGHFDYTRDGGRTWQPVGTR